MEEELPYEAMHVQLLNELERILQSDPLIDEVGFVHPAQFATLESKHHESPSSVSNIADSSTKHVSSSFWNRDHKLGISTDAVLPLYRAAKRSFMAAVKEYKSVNDLSDNDLSSVKCEVMKHSRALLLVSYDFGTAWHSRKSIVSKESPLDMYMNELHLSALVLSYAPKCEHAWSHRRWVIKSIYGRCLTLQEMIGKESELVETIAERSKMNYRAWNHRCWLVSYMSAQQAYHELKKSRNWASSHVADNSCFHYRRRLMLKVLERSSDNLENTASIDIHHLWKDELDWNKSLIKLYVGRECLWLHRRILALVLVTRLPTLSDINDNGISTFLSDELHLVVSCLTVEDNEFEDHQAQALYSATYILWLAKRTPESHGIEFLNNMLRDENLTTILNKACPEKSFLWDYSI